MTKILKVVGASWLQTKISSYILGVLGILAILTLFVGQIERSEGDGNYAATVFYSEKTGYRIEYWGQSNELAAIPRGVARAYFRKDVDTNGWSLLEVETDGSYHDDIQAYAAGVVEGALTWSLIHNHLDNTIRAKCDGQPLEKQCDKLRDHLDVSVNKWKSHAAEREATDPFWHQVSLHYIQIGGIFTGWKYGIVRSLYEYDADISDLYWLNSIAEVSELERKLNISVEDQELYKLPGLSSAFLRAVNETSEDGSVIRKLYLAQNAVGGYNSMTRIIKRYIFNYHMTTQDTALAPGRSVEFSSYPGSVTSQDDFYILEGKDHRMAVTGSTLRNYNAKLWKNVNIVEQVPLGPRISAANHLSTNVSSWSHTLAANNSGTGAKQWLVVDFNKFDELHSLPQEQTEANTDIVTEINVNNDVKHIVFHRAHAGPSGLVWLVEQVPGLTHARDLTVAFLEQGYWATYGLPYIHDIAEITHTTRRHAAYGDIFSSEQSPRAINFKRGFKNATTLDSIVKLMRQNNVTAIHSASDSNDSPCHEGDCIIQEKGYWAVLGARGDLVSRHKAAYGVIDTKVVVGTKNITQLEFVAVAGPPYTDVQQVNVTKTLLNKGTIASATTYTDQFNNEAVINGIEIRNTVEKQQEIAAQEALDMLNRDVIKPFQWSDSEYSNTTHTGLPDKWAFEPFKPKWSW